MGVRTKESKPFLYLGFKIWVESVVVGVILIGLYGDTTLGIQSFL